MATAAKKPRKVLTLVERKAKIETAQKKIANEAAKIAVEETEDALGKFQPSSVAKLFTEFKASNAKIKDMDILMTLAKFAKLNSNPPIFHRT